MREQKHITPRTLAVVSLIGIGLLLVTILHAGARPAAEQLRSAAAQRGVSRLDTIIWDYQEIARQDPRSADARAVLGLAYIQKARETGDAGYYAKAEQVLGEALRISPQHIDALIGQGSLALSRHQFREALQIGEQARAINPRIPRIYGVIADAEIELGMYEQAIATVQTMVDLRPDLSSYSRVAYARELHGDLDGAIEAMEMAVEAGGPALENVEWTRTQLASLHFAKGDLESAEQIYRLSLSRSPDYAYALAGLARVEAAQGKSEQAIQHYQQAIARVPLPEFVIGLGELYESLGRTNEAQQQYELVRAMQQLFRASGVDTDLELALFEADHGADQRQALALARKAYADRPSVKAADALAWALYRAGEYGEARRYADQALALGTNDALMLYHAGMIARAQGDMGAAHTLLGRAIELNPGFSPLYAPLARQALADMQGAAHLP